MLDALLDLFNTIHPLDTEVSEQLKDSFEIITTDKKQVLVKEGDVCNYVYLLLDGLARMYYIKEDMEICSLFFFEPNHLFTVPNSFYSRQPGYHFIETLEVCTLGRISYNKLQQLYTTYPALNFVGRVITENYFVKSEERLYLLRKRTAEERYMYIVERYPMILQKIPLTYVATYLGITLETLSRIRNKIRK